MKGRVIFMDSNKVGRVDLEIYVRGLLGETESVASVVRPLCPACGSHFIQRLRRPPLWRYLFARTAGPRYQCSNCARRFYVRSSDGEEIRSQDVRKERREE